MKQAPKKEREPRPPREPWQVCRAQYLMSAGRLDQLKAEGLEHYVPAKAKGAHA